MIVETVEKGETLETARQQGGRVRVKTVEKGDARDSETAGW